jgi:hypothetical protein
MSGIDSECAAPQESSIANNAAPGKSRTLAFMRKFLGAGFPIIAVGTILILVSSCAAPFASRLCERGCSTSPVVS